MTGLGIGFLAGFVSVKFTDTREMVWVGIAVGVQVRERTRACVRACVRARARVVEREGGWRSSVWWDASPLLFVIRSFV